MNPLEPRSGSIHILQRHRASVRVASIRWSQGCGLTNYNRSSMQPCWLRTLMQDAARATHSLAGSQAAQELNGHCPRRSNPLLINASCSRGEFGLLGQPRVYAGILNASPRASTAQASRAFFAAMATTAFQ